MKNEESLTVSLFDSLILGDSRVIEQFKEAMGRLAGSVNAITSCDNEKSVGLIATAVCSLSAEPPSVVICVNKNASAHDAIIEYGYFGLNLLSHGHADVVSEFTRKDGGSKFNSEHWDQESFCVPVLRDAPYAMVCKVGKQYDGFTHSIIVGVIEVIKLCEDDKSNCLLWKGKGLHEAIAYISKQEKLDHVS